MLLISSLSGFTVLLIACMLLNNRIVKQKNRVHQAYGTIEVYLKQRFDMLPNMVALLDRYIEHEADLYKSVSKLRERVENTEDVKEQVGISTDFSNLMRTVVAKVESYPEIKADKQFLNMQGILKHTEEQLAASRRAYNSAVTVFNDSIELIPSSLIARLRREEKWPLLEIPEIEKANIRIEEIMK